MSTDEKRHEQHPASHEEIDACFAAVAPGSGPLDGQSFEGEARKNGSTETEPLHLIFRHGALLAVECMPFAFGAGPYTASAAADGSVEFTSEIRSLEHETENHIWTGRVKDGATTGKMVWTNREGKTTELSFKGQLATAKE